MFSGAANMKLKMFLADIATKNKKYIQIHITYVCECVCVCVCVLVCACVFAQQLFPFIRQPFVANSGQCLHRETERERYRKSEPESKA